MFRVAFGVLDDRGQGPGAGALRPQEQQGAEAAEVAIEMANRCVESRASGLTTWVVSVFKSPYRFGAGVPAGRGRPGGREGPPAGLGAR